MNLREKNLTDLRQIGISFGISDVFSMDRVDLELAISEAQVASLPEPKIEIKQPEYDARYMNKPPSKRITPELIERDLEVFRGRGLLLRFDEERWYMKFGDRTDEGSLRMPLSAVLRCAQKLME